MNAEKDVQNAQKKAETAGQKSLVKKEGLVLVQPSTGGRPRTKNDTVGVSALPEAMQSHARLSEIAVRAARADSGSKGRSAKYNIVWQHVDDVTACKNCSKSFGVLRRKQHCRGCGFIYCGACLSTKLQVPGSSKRKGCCIECVKLSKNGVLQKLGPTGEPMFGQVNEAYLQVNEFGVALFPSNNNTKPLLQLDYSEVRSVSALLSSAELPNCFQIQGPVGKTMLLGTDEVALTEDWIAVISSNLSSLSAQGKLGLQRA